jgi:hypothetical protein
MFNRKIFVSIASYQDAELWHTINDMVLTASRPSRLHICILDQSETPSPPTEGVLQRVYKITYTNISPKYSRGPCWARHVLQSYVRDEEFYLQIDAHMRFDEGWDDYLVNTYDNLSEKNIRTLLSTYVGAFDKKEDGTIYKHKFPGHSLVLKPDGNEFFKTHTPILIFQAFPTPSQTPILGSHTGGAFIFGPSAIVQEVPYDPWLYFHGEEQNQAIRAYTHGWDIYHPTDVPIYHLYNDNRTRHWHEDKNTGRTEEWIMLDREANQRMYRLLYDRAPLGIYGLGFKRTLEEFAEFSGIDYINRTIRR